MKHHSCRIVVFLALLSAALPAVAQAPHPLAPSDVFAIKEVGEMQLSADGLTLAVVVSETDLTANRVVSRLMTMPASGGALQPLAGAPAGASNIRWAPHGGRLAFLASSDGRSAVWVIDVPTGRLARVCDYGRGNSFLSKAGNSLAWSPDGTQLAFAGTLDPAPPPADPLVVSRIQYKTRTSISDNRRSHIFVVAADGGTPRAVTSGGFDEHSIDWGGDGSEIVFLSNREPDPDARLNYDIFAVGVASGAVRRLTSTPGVEFDPQISPDGRSIAFVATTRPETTIDSIAEDPHVWVMPAAGGAARELNRGLDRRSSEPTWTRDGRAVVYLASDHGKTVVHRVPIDGGETRAILDRRAQVSIVAAAPGDSFFVALSDPRTPREVFRVPGAGLVPQALTHLNRDAVAGWTLVAPETLAFAGADGTPIEGWFYPALGTAGRWPMLLTIHGGPHGSFGYAFSSAAQVNAGRGYATLVVNPRGSSGYGQAFSDGCVGNWGGGDYQDLMAGVDFVLRTRPKVDPARLGVTGGSYGGFMTNWVITETHRFKAAVAVASLSDLVSFYATSMYQDLVHTEFGGLPWAGDNFATLWKWSPLSHAAGVTTPTLFIHGEQDNDVHITQAEEMYTALRRQGIEAVLVRYPREGHGFREPKHNLDRTIRTLDWFDRHLLQ